MANEFSVLIVEDNDDARRNMEDILSLDGYKVESVSHCLAAIHAVEVKSFDMVIVDWRLPDSNADSLIPIIVSRQPNTPVVVVTGIRDFDTAVTALRSGAYDFLLKPINVDVLRSVLNRIVERKKHLNAIESAREKLLMNERLAAIGQMVTGLAHESRNAFQRSHACLAELSLDLEGQPDSLKLVQKIQKALDDLHSLFEEVRDYSAPIILERRRCCLETLVRETWQHILDTKKGLNVPKFSLTKAANFPELCMIDNDRIQQVLRNVLENALFASPPNGTVTVHLGLNRLNSHSLRIEVEDQGEGVAIENRESIFTPFYTTKTKGTGLGLAISRRYIAAHDGQLFVEDHEGPGARFVIEIPIKPS